MLTIYIILLFISEGFIWTHTRNIHFELDGHITNSVINFSVFVENGSGLIFYSSDSHNQFMIKLDNNETEQNLFVYYNNYHQISAKLKPLCGSLICNSCFMSFILNLEKWEISLNCNNSTSSLIMNNNSQSTDPFQGFPTVPPQIIDKIYIWMGNIGPYVGHRYRKYYPFSYQLIGCLNWFYINNKLVASNVVSKYFKSSCDVIYNETICNSNICGIKTIPSKLYHCSLDSFNIIYCDLKFKEYYKEGTVSVTIPNNSTKYILKIVWENKNIILTKLICLIELVLKDNSFILFYIAEANLLFMNKANGSPLKYEKLFKINISPTSINIIIIFVDNFRFTMKIFNGFEIKTSEYEISSEIILMNIGHCQHTNVFHNFIGKINFQSNLPNIRNNNGTTPSLNPISISKKKSIFLLC